MKRELPKCLAWAGALGHPWITVVREVKDENWRVRAECNTGSDAFRYYAEDVEAGREAAIFTRSGRSWKSVRPSAASIA